MEGWQQDWIKMLETVAEEIDRFFENVAKEVNDAADAFAELTEEVVEQVEEAIAPAFDRVDEQLDSWIEPLLAALMGFESAVSDAAAPVTHTVEPMLNQHTVCVGCRHYHGQSYNGVMFVCAMHPYGMEEGVETCPDKEAITWSFPRPDSSNPPDDSW